MTVAENMAFGMEMRGVSKPEREKAVAEVAKTLAVGASSQAPSEPTFRGSASASQWDAHWFAQPRVFLFDEPLSNLDANLRVDMRVEIKAPAPANRRDDRLCHARSDRSHDACDANRRSEGRRASAGRHAVRSLQHARKSIRRRFHGLPSMNLLEGMVSRSNGAASVVIERAGTCSDRVSRSHKRERGSSARARRSSSAFPSDSFLCPSYLSHAFPRLVHRASAMIRRDAGVLRFRPMTSEGQVTEWLTRWRAGDREALGECSCRSLRRVASGRPAAVPT